jgi:tetratricopeptide (TPR) repeat protein
LGRGCNLRGAASIQNGNRGVFAIRKRVQNSPAWAALAALAIVSLTAGTQVPAARSQQTPSSSNYTGISVQSSQQIFATMCALDAAGFGADESTLSEMPYRLKLRDDLLKMQGPATSALRQFYRQHAFSTRAETLSRYITFSLVVGPPPEFKFLYDRDLLPPDVLTIQEFQPILSGFYREADLGERWQEIEPEYERAQALYDAPVRNIVMLTNAYLREILSASRGRTFTVYVEPLVGRLTNFRIYGSTYSIVVGTPAPLPLSDIQHAYLHFLLDPLPLRYAKEVDAKSDLLKIAAQAPRLPADYQDDFVSFTDECLIRAVELRLKPLSPEQLESALKQEDESGFILVRPFVGQLMKFEKAGPAIEYYFPDLIAGIDVAAEEKRLQGVKFASAQATPPSEHGESFGGPSATTVTPEQLLAEGERAITLREPARAKAAFDKVLAKNPNDTRALYGLALASVLNREADTAKKLFEKVIVLSQPSETEQNTAPTDPTMLAWSHIYLGRIFDLEDDRESAIGEYQAALAVVGAPESARVAAQEGVKSAYQPVPPAQAKPQ